MRMRLFLLAAAVAALVPARAALAQTGTLSGHVTDAETTDDLIGVDIFLSPSGKAMQTDLDGRFSFAGLTPGSYSLHLAYLGYADQDVKMVQVGAGKTATVEIRLEPAEAFATEDMVITAERVLTTETAVLAERQDSAVIGDAISAAQVQKSPDSNTGDALKRVTGLTVNEGKYVFVRGVSDRYNVTEVNGVAMNGANVDRDRKSFNFDMVPANLLANITVIKQATPDLPGDFTGGLVRINTLEFPENPTTSVSVSIGSTPGTTGKGLRFDAQRGKTDWLGYDDGGRDFPTALLDSSVVYQNTSLRNPDLARGLPNRWVTESRTAPPKLSFALSHGNKFALMGADIGFMGALSYDNRFELEDENEVRIGGNPIDASGTTHHAQATTSGLLNLFGRKGNHRLGVTNLYNHTADTDITFMNGVDQKTFEWQTMSWHERTQFVDKIDGRHHLPGPGAGFDLDWQYCYGESHAAEPDRRYLAYNLDFEPRVMDENMRTWTWLDEFRRGGGVDLAWSPAAAEDAAAGPVQVKGGYREDHRSRTFDIQSWYTTPSQGPNFDYGLTFLPPDSIFRPENYNEVSNPRRGALWEYAQDPNLSGSYTADHDLQAWYGMVDLPFRFRQEDLRVTGGARVEMSDQVVYSIRNKLFPERQDTSRVDTRDVLPSLGVTWTPEQNTNVRLGYSKTLNRPEFREMSPILRRDYRTFENQRGNPNLKRALIDNYDVRLETFPRAGEVLAASVFYKRLVNAIEDTLLPEAERPTASFTSTPLAKNWGLELEAIRRLDWLSATRNFTVSANFTRIWSEVVFDNPRTLEVVEQDVRPLQGQAPWSINLSLAFASPATQTSANILFNRIGRRLDKISENMFEYVYLEPRSKIDLVATQELPWSLRLKLAVSDLLADNTIRTSSTEDGRQYVYSDLEESSVYTMSVSGRF